MLAFAGLLKAPLTAEFALLAFQSFFSLLDAGAINLLCMLNAIQGLVSSAVLNSTVNSLQ